MSKLIDLTEQKFGKLTVIKRSLPNKCSAIMWLCKCDCGKEKVIRGGSLKSGGTKSCGCLWEKNKLSSGLASMRGLMRNYKRNAKKEGRKWCLTEKQFAKITKEECFYCGLRPKQRTMGNHTNGEYIYNGIDRVDSSKGYTINNVVPCCKICNIAKHNLNLQEYKNWIEKSYNKMFGGEK